MEVVMEEAFEVEGVDVVTEFVRSPALFFALFVCDGLIDLRLEVHVETMEMVHHVYRVCVWFLVAVRQIYVHIEKTFCASARRTLANILEYSRPKITLKCFPLRDFDILVLAFQIS